MSKKAIRAGVIGFPVGHSKSPLIHNTWIKRMALAGEYDAIEIPPSEFTRESLDTLVSGGYSGFNLTIPHKETGYDFCDDLDDIALAVQAVNTIFVKDGKLHGTNTDVYGFVQSLKNAAPDYDVASAPAIVLGAGGAARAAVHGLLQEGAPEVRLFNRLREKAELVAESSADPSRVRVFEWDRRNAQAGNSGLVVNATSLGMKRHEPLLMDYRQFSQSAIVYDMIYAPPVTKFLADANKAGLHTVNGAGMLAYQAAAAFEIWFGKRPVVDEEIINLVLG